jgi:hypothetical protein
MTGEWNSHYYAQVNPQWIRETRSQTVSSVNVCCGVINQHVVGPHFFEGNLNGEMHLNFIHLGLNPLLEEVALKTRENLGFQQDGAHKIVRRYLDIAFRNRWIGRGSVNIWQLRNPDLTPFLWGTLKQKIYESPILNIDPCVQAEGRHFELFFFICAILQLK